MSDPTTPTYAEEAAIQDQLLDKRLGEIRAWEQAGTITVTESAELRIAAMEHHIETIRNLRNEYFGG